MHRWELKGLRYLGEAGLTRPDLKYGVHVKLCWAHRSQILCHTIPDDGGFEDQESTHFWWQSCTVKIGRKSFFENGLALSVQVWDRPVSSHLHFLHEALTDGTTEGHFSVTLRKVHISHGQVGPLHKDREVYLAPLQARQQKNSQEQSRNSDSSYSRK